MILLFDIGNTNTHVGLANNRRVVRQTNIPTAAWFDGSAPKMLRRFVESGLSPVAAEVTRRKPQASLKVRLLTSSATPTGAALCSVVPRTTPFVRRAIQKLWKSTVLELTPKTLGGVGVDYPKPGTIGPDRLANAVAARHRFGAPVVVVDFGTAVTFDVVDSCGNYVGGIIAPGLAAMTDYLHEKTALLPRIKIREIKTAVGKSTEQAMLVGAVHGYRGLVRGLITELKRELKARRLPVVATGGYAKLIAAKLPEISKVEPNLTLEGLRLVWMANYAAK